MHRVLILSLGLFLFSSSAVSAQSYSTDSQTLQALLAEVRQLRQDLQTTTGAVQRAQILLYRVQTQEAVVARANERLTEARAKLEETQSQKKKLEAELKQSEEFVSHSENPPLERKEHETMIAYFKSRLEALASEEQEKLAKQIDTEQQLRSEQAKLADLQSRLDRLDLELQNAVRQSPRAQR